LADVSAFYAFQGGNNKLHGSKGIGREVYAMAGVLDRARNEVVDRLELSGKVLMQCDERDIKRFRMSVVGAAILIPQGYNVQQQKIDGAVDAFFKLDQFLTDLLDQIVGWTSPKQFEGDRVTKAAVELYAARDEERRDAIIERFLTHFGRMMSTVQRRICDPRTIEQDAKEAQGRLLQIMSPEELAYLATQPAVEAVSDYSQMEEQAIVAIAQEGRGNPLYNQRELERRKLTAQIDSEFADAVLLPENDPTVQAENARQQQLELLPIQNGQPVPVSPRDNHEVHLGVLQNAVTATIQGGDHPQMEQMLTAYANHAQAHIQAAIQQGQGEQMNEFKQWLAGVQNTVEQLQAAIAKEAQKIHAGMAAQPGQAPPQPQPGPPPQ
jgi:hypothetical protein